MAAHSDGIASRMTIDELAHRAGATTRTVRSYQERGLLPAPKLVGRTGYYDEGHLARLQLIARLLEQHFSLAAIGSLLAAWERGKTLGDVLGFEEALVTPYEHTAPVPIDDERMAELFPTGGDAQFDRSVALGMLQPTEDGRWVSFHPGLLEAGAVLASVGYPIDELLDEFQQLREDCDRIAARFSEQFWTHVWQPFIEAGRPAEDLARLTEVLDALRPLPGNATAALLNQMLQRRLEEMTAHLLADTAGLDGQSSATA